MVVEAVVVGIDGTCPEAPGWVTISYQLSKTEHTTRDGKLEMARLENEAALGVKLAPGAFERLAAYGRVVAHFPTAVKEFEWRNGWFYAITEAAVKDGKADPCPLHTAGLKELGVVKEAVAA